MRLIKAFAGACLALVMGLPALAAERAIIVLDGSGSMWAQVDGTPRISIARDTLSEVLSTLPGDLELGLLTYGHREKGNCGDIELLVAPASGSAAAINAAASKINPKGMTPLSDAVRIAAEELRYTEEAATVILITDGLETCEVNPCALGNELESMGVNFTAHVLGFGLSDEEGRQVACLAENTGGRYLSANDGAGLVDALTTAVAEVVEVAADPEPEPAPEPEAVVHEFNLVPSAYLAEGVPYSRDLGQLVWEIRKVGLSGPGEHLQTEYNEGAKFNLEPGEYFLVATFGQAQVNTKIEMVEGELLEPVIILNAGVVDVTSAISAGQQPNSNTMIRMHYDADNTVTFGSGRFLLPAGNIRMVVTHDSVEYVEEFKLAAGEILAKEVDLGAGLVAFTSVYAEGVELNSSYVRHVVVRAKKTIDGRYAEVDRDYSDATMLLAPGDYIVQSEFEAAKVETPLTITNGERVDLVVNFNAGVAAFNAPGADRIVVYEARPSIDGSRKEVARGYDADWQQAFNAGEYLAVADLPDSVRYEVPFTVLAGERVEVELSEAAVAAAGIAADQAAAEPKAEEAPASKGDKKKTK